MAASKPPNTETVIYHIPLADIRIDPKWNSRSSLDDEGGDEENDDSIAGLAASIAASGQDTAVVLTSDPLGKKKYFLVNGFRRAAAIMLNAKEAKDKNPTIRAEIKELDDYAARAANIRENVKRMALSVPDQAHALFAARKANPTVTDGQLAEDVGIHQTYANQLLNIMKNTDPEVTKAWRESRQSISVNKMKDLSKLPIGEQKEAFATLLEAPPPVKGPNAWIETARKAGMKVGAMLGELVKAEQISLIDDSRFFSRNIRTLVSFKKNEEGDKAITTIAKACRQAYKDSFKEEVLEEETVDA